MQNHSSLIGLLNNIYIVKGGGEIVSPILNGETNDWQSQIRTICAMLSKEFDQEDTENIDRASIHVHVNLSDSFSLWEVKNLVRLAVAFEPFLYRLGGMGRLNRCSLNNFTFSRPILKPSVYKYDDGNYYPMFNWKAMLEAESLEEFFNLFYSAVWARDRDVKYFPARYVGLNFYSLLIRHSIELRYANFTNIPEYFIAWVMLCRQFVIKASQSETSELNIVRSLEQEYTTEDLLEFLSYIRITDPYTRILLNMWNESSVAFDGSYCKSHVDTFDIDPKVLQVQKVDKKNLKEPLPRNARDIQNIVQQQTNRTLSKNRNNMPKIGELDYRVITPKNERGNRHEKFEYNKFLEALNFPDVVDDMFRGKNIDPIEAFWNEFPYAEVRNSNLNKMKYVRSRFANEMTCYIFPVFTDFKKHTFKMRARGREIHVHFQLIQMARDSYYITLRIEDNKGTVYESGLVKLDYDLRRFGYYFNPTKYMEEFFNNVQNNNH